MNISTGGPHILLFERDQQLAALLSSELQLAGYELHTARTAVEVFDAIARHPIKLVLVNLAQAAAARREFWVALDSQRRVSGIQVLTFHCANLAGYGPHDPEDRSSATMADIEVDGMLGLMSLVDAVRARIPGPSMNTNSMPRFPRTATSAPSVPSVPSVPSTPQITVQKSPQQPMQEMNNNGLSGGGTSYRTTFLPDNPMRGTSASSSQMPANTPVPSIQSPSSIQSPAPMSNGGNQPTYTEKIRAVLYPNQRTWSSQGSGNFSTMPENRLAQESQSPPIAAIPTSPSSSDSTVLQRLANGQTGFDASKGSGLAQLSRMAQGRQPAMNDNATTLYSDNNVNTTTFNNTLYQAQETVPSPGPRAAMNGQMLEQASQYNPPVSRPTQTSENINQQTLRASPIQDMPIERPSGGQSASETSRRSDVRPDVLSRTNYGQQTTPTVGAIPPLASIASSTPATSPALSKTTPLAPPPPQEEKKRPVVQAEPRIEEIRQETASTPTTTIPIDAGKENGNRAHTEHTKENMPQAEPPHTTDLDEPTAPSNAMLLDIVQSLPPMSPLPSQSQTQAQSIQPPVLNGRATRSLGSVLLNGHLVPEDRLGVAQNIQRMLRGVDLNYQLGEILLMFKLLSPDQLLAASLVSYGLITTTQISALGRIRQELHSIGLEYDLENLLIMFRILTPEQLREVRASWQSL